MTVVFFDQQMGAPHAILKSFISGLKQVFLYFSITNRKKEKKERKESTKIMQKNMHKKGVYHRIGVNLKRWLTPNSWSTPGENLRKIIFFPGVNQLLGINQRLRLTPKCW